MSSKKQEYVIDWDAYKKAYYKKHNKETDIYKTAEDLQVTYQTIQNITRKNVKTIQYLKTMAKISGEPINKLIKKLN